MAGQRGHGQESKWEMENVRRFHRPKPSHPKDSFPLPRIDQLVDSTTRHKLLTFMDAFSGYNQILMAEEDQEKTAFVTSQGLYYYRVKIGRAHV